MLSRNISVLGGSLIEQDSKKEENYKLYKYRFIIVFVYVVASNMNILMWSVFGPIQTILQHMYNEDITFVNFATILISNVSYIPANFIGNYIVDVHGLRIGTIFGSLLGLIGLWIRCLSKEGFIFIFIGQIFAGFAQPYFYSTPQKFSNVWFAPAERSYATTLMSCASLLGNAIGPLVPQWFQITDDTDDYDSLKPKLQKMMFYAALLGSGVFVVTVLLMREKPATPPSKAAAAEKHSFGKSLKKLLTNKNAMIMIASTAIVNGGLVNYISVVQQVTSPYGFSSSAIGDIISISTFVGLVGAFVGAALIHKFKIYNLVIIGSSIAAFLLMLLNFFAAKSGNTLFLGVSVTAFSTIIAPVLPVALEYGVELAFPVAEATIGGIWFVINQLSSTIISLIIDKVLGNTPTASDSQICFIIMIACQGVILIPLFFVRENLKRANYEKRKSMKLADESVENDKQSPLLAKEITHEDRFSEGEKLKVAVSPMRTSDIV